MTDKRYQLRQEDLDYPIYSDLVDIEDNDRVICSFNNDSQINKMVVLLNEKEERIKELEKENEQLKHSYKKLKHRHSLLHDVCLDAECDRDSFKKDVISLEKENEKLRQELESFEQINFTDLCDGTRTILYMKKEKYINKENVGDENE